MNPAFYFEIPVADLPRAIKFYGAVFGHAFERASVHGNEMAFFPYALGQLGVRLYFDVADIQHTLEQAVQAGGAVLYPRTAVAGFRWVAEMLDSEGNCIGLHTRPQPDTAAG